MRRGRRYNFVYNFDWIMALYACKADREREGADVSSVSPSAGRIKLRAILVKTLALDLLSRRANPRNVSF